MKNLFINIIIFLFEKYAFDIWVDKQGSKEKEDIMKENDLKTDEEFNDFMLDRQQGFGRESYYAGVEDGYNRALEKRL